jgi:hypothetical protein
LVEKINEKEVEITIVPKLRRCNSISLSPGDTLLVHVDQDIWDLDAAQNFYDLFSKSFPNNNIVVTFKGIEIGVIKENDKI